MLAHSVLYVCVCTRCAASWRACSHSAHTAAARRRMLYFLVREALGVDLAESIDEGPYVLELTYILCFERQIDTCGPV